MSEYASIIHVKSLMDTHTPHMLLCVKRCCRSSAGGSQLSMAFQSGSFHDSWSFIQTTAVVRPRSIPNTQKHTSLMVLPTTSATKVHPSRHWEHPAHCWPGYLILHKNLMNRWPDFTKAHSMGLPLIIALRL